MIQIQSDSGNRFLGGFLEKKPGRVPVEPSYSGVVLPHLKWNPFLSEVYSRVHFQGYDCKISVCADSMAGSQTRIGKSSLALRFGELWDRDYKNRVRFNVDRVVSNFEEFKDFLRGSHPRGTVVLMEEAQTWLNSRTFSSRQNLDIVHKFSTGGLFGYIFLMTYPQFETIDSQVRPLIHYEVRVTLKDLFRKLIHYTPYRCHPGWSLRDDIYREPFFVKENGIRHIFTATSTLPSKDLMGDYEVKMHGVKSAISRSESEVAGRRPEKIGGRRSGVLSEEEICSLVLKAGELGLDSFRRKKGLNKIWVLSRLESGLGVSNKVARVLKFRLELMEKRGEII